MFQSEATCEAIHMKMIFHSRAFETRFQLQMFCTQPGFESESFWNSEMALSQLQSRRRGLINRENEKIITIEPF